MTQDDTRLEYETTPTAPSVEHRRLRNTSCSPVQSGDSFKMICAATASGSTNRTTSRPSSEQEPAQTSSTTGSCQLSVICKQPYSSLGDYATSIFTVKKRWLNTNSVRPIRDECYDVTTDILSNTRICRNYESIVITKDVQ